MKKAANKQPGQSQEKDEQATSAPKFRLIKNENWKPAGKPKARIKLLGDKLPPAA